MMNIYCIIIAWEGIKGWEADSFCIVHFASSIFHFMEHLPFLLQSYRLTVLPSYSPKVLQSHILPLRSLRFTSSALKYFGSNFPPSHSR